MQFWILQLTDAAVTLKCGLSHWNLHKWVKLNMSHHHAKSSIYHIYRVSENCKDKMFHTGQSHNNHHTEHFFMWANKNKKMFWTTTLCVVISGGYYNS